MENQELAQENPPISWSGSFPQNYEDNLNFIFGPYAEEMAQRVEPEGLEKVLELACGTGSVTLRLLKRLDPHTELIATDLSPDMMKIGESLIQASNLQWKIMDMCNISFPTDHFDLILCQFGLMFASDKLTALKEMLRVLKPGGRIIINTWGLIQNNQIFGIFNEILKKFMSIDLGVAEQSPFSLQDHTKVLELMKESGFINIKECFLDKTGESPSAEQAAKGFFQGSQLAVQLKQNNPNMGEKIQLTAQNEFSSLLGDHPMKTKLRAWFFEANK